MIFSQLGIRMLHSPEDDTTQAMLDVVKQATKSVYVTIYGFHLPALRDELIAKHQAGLDVSVILDHTQAEGKAEHPDVQMLYDAGVPVVIGTSSEHHQIIHDKNCVVDGHLVETGSWNYSLSASWQDNTMWIIDSAEVASALISVHQTIRSWIVVHEKMLQLHDIKVMQLTNTSASASASDEKSAA